MFVNDLRQVSGFSPVSFTNKTDFHNITESGIKHHNIKSKVEPIIPVDLYP
jgi:hypothetical protein